ncbi:tetraspanin-17-like [Asterias amurensis]|uniref:tetraspanin-17-like n=1 Tax=Asterias amurensis TaxID=7602 RepID=UPI003AB4A014
MYPPDESRPPPYSGYGGEQQPPMYHQQHQAGYPPPQQQGYPGPGGPAGAARGQGPKAGRGGRQSRAAPQQRAQQQQQPQSRKQQQRKHPQQQQQQRPPQPKQKAQVVRAQRRDEHSEISLCIKFSLFFANFVFWIAGCACIAAGVWAWSDRGVLGDLDQLISSPLVDPVWWFLVIGGVIFILATFGCIGALRENIMLLKIYSGLLGLILLVEIGGGVAIYFYRAELESLFADQLTDIAITNYRGNEDFQDVVDALQTGLSCCGVNGYQDWDMNIYFNCSESYVGNNKNLEACGVPFSCCLIDPAVSEVINTQCGYNVRSESLSQISSKINTVGCLSSFQMWLQTNLVVIAIAAGVILLIEIFGFCFSTSLVSDIKRQKSKWRH